MTRARIFKPCKTATQSGKSKTRCWILEFLPVHPNFIEPVMGWRGSDDTFHQMRLVFPSLQSAISYAQQNNIDFQIENKSSISPALPKKYSDNFRYDRVD